MQVHTASIRFMIFVCNLVQIHLISFNPIAIHLDALESIQIHTASLQIFSASLRLIQIHEDLGRFVQTSSNQPILKGKGKRRRDQREDEQVPILDQIPLE